MGRLFSSSAGIMFNGGSCLFQGFPPSPTLLYTIRYVFIFAVVFWAYKVCMLWLILINVDNSLLFTRLYCRNSVLFKLSIWLLFFIFFWKRCLFLPCARFVENWSNRSSGVQITWDICTRFGHCLYSTELSWIIKHMSFSSVKISRFSLKITWYFIGVCGVVMWLASNGVVEGKEKRNRDWARFPPPIHFSRLPLGL